MNNKTFKTVGAALMILGVVVAFVAAGSMDGGASISVLLMLVLSALALLFSGLALVQFGSGIESIQKYLRGQRQYIKELEEQNDRLFGQLQEPSDCLGCPFLPAEKRNA